MSVSRAEAKGWARESLHGLWTSPVIPVNPDGSLDVQGIRDNVDYMLQLRVGGLGFGFSEPWYFTIEERIEAFKAFVDAVSGRALCYCHALDYSVPETIRLVGICKDIGADAVMLWTPMEFAKTENDAVEWYEYVGGQIDLPLFAYNTYHSGRNLSIGALERVAQIEPVCALKDAINDVGHTVAAMQAFGDQIVVSEPLEKNLLPMTQNFNQQVMLGTTSVFLMQSPALQPVQDYLELASADPAEAWKRYYELEPLRKLWNDVYDVLWQKDAAVHPLATVKYWMDLIGMRGGIVRPPLHQLDDAQKAAFRARLEATGWVDRLYPTACATCADDVAVLVRRREPRPDPREARSESGAILEVSDLYCRYSDYDVVKGASLRVGEGEVVGLLGPNGAGKTTMLRAIMGLLRRRRGSIRICGVETIDWPAHQISRGYAAIAPEGRRLFADQLVRDNLELGALHLRGDSKRAAALTESVYGLFPVLRERRNQLASTLSGGEAQMLAVGRMLASDPRLLLLDEPSFGLAPLAIDALFAALAELRSQRRSVLLVEQRVDLAMRVCDRLYVLSGGQIVREQRVEDVEDGGRDLIDDYLG